MADFYNTAPHSRIVHFSSGKTLTVNDIIKIVIEEDVVSYSQKNDDRIIVTRNKIDFIVVGKTND